MSRLTRKPSLLDPSKAPEFLAAAWTCSSDGLAREAGWTARIPLDDGLAATAAWYRQAGWL